VKSRTKHLKGRREEIIYLLNKRYEMDKDFNYRDRVITLDNVNYRLLKCIDKTATNLHHIISRKENKKFNVHHERNKMVINMRVHDALNRLF
jgi:hypothetical protein